MLHPPFAHMKYRTKRYHCRSLSHQMASYSLLWARITRYVCSTSSLVNCILSVLVFVLSFLNYRRYRTYNESLQILGEQQKDDESFYKLEPIDFGRRMAVERELDAALVSDSPSTPAPSVLFDESGNFIMYPMNNTTVFGYIYKLRVKL